MTTAEFVDWFAEKWTPEPFSGCWLWTAFTNHLGYGKLWHKGTTMAAHRVSWEMHNGVIPEGMNVLHTCDTRSCVNPKHLWIGTQRDNVRDMDAKKRRNPPFGERNAACKLTPELVRNIRLETGKQRDIGKKYGISHRQVGNIQNGKHWKHVR